MPGLPETHSLDAKPRTAVTWPRPNVAHVVLEGEHDMHFLRYDEVPTHIAQKIIEETKRSREEEKV